MVIDDTLTTGGSIINTIKEIQSVGANVKLSLSIFDRNEGGKEKIEKLELIIIQFLDMTRKKRTGFLNMYRSIT